MIRYVIFFLSVFATSAVAQKTDTDDNTIGKRVQQFYTLFPQEKSVLITDNSVYIPGETIWFKVYLWNQTQSISNHCHVVLRSGKEIISQQKVLIRDEQGHGDLFLPSTIREGIYVLEVYTLWTTNFYPEPISSRTIWIGTGHKETRTDASNSKVLIAPEGGGLRPDGTRNKIAIYTGTLNARGFSFELFDPTNKSIYFRKFENAIGVAEVFPNVEGEYIAEICIEETSVCHNTKLRTKNFGLQVVEISEKQVTVAVTLGDKRDHMLVSCTDQQLLETRKTNGSSGSINFSLDNYPAGIIYFLLCNSEGVESTRAIYNRKSKATSLRLVPPGESRGLQSPSKRITIVSSQNEDVCAFAGPGDGFLGNYTFASALNDSSGSLNDLMLFKRYLLKNSMNYFVKNLFLPIKSDSKKNEVTKLASDSVSFGPLELVLSNLLDQPGIDSIIRYKQNIEAIKNSYNTASNLVIEKIPADESYLPSEYPTITSARDLLEHAIPRLKTRNDGTSKSYHFFYTNLKDEKVLHSDPPALVINGYRMHDFSLLREIPLIEITSIDAIYNSRSLVNSNLLGFFPSGALLVYLREKSGYTEKLINASDNFFAAPYSWPHQFPNDARPNLNDPSQKRFPLFNSLYFWAGRLKPLSREVSFEFIRPPFTPPHTIFFAFSLSDIKEDVYTVMKTD
jgi:hypothetical protein